MDATNGPRATLEAQGLTHRYGRRVGLRPVTFRAQAPGVLGVRGANGSGKSTLLRILAGLLRHSEGRVALLVDGAEVAPAARMRRMGYAAPDLSFYPELTVTENLGFTAEARGLERPRDRVRAVLERVGLQRRAHDRVSALSSGMVQRLRLAFAVLADPPVLLLDEPDSHLDDEGKAGVGSLVRSERSERLVVVATNEWKEFAFADQWVELEGRGLGDPA